jgi:hypothetical protein
MMLGRFRMTTHQALDKYVHIISRVFASSNKKNHHQDGAFKATTLETEIKTLIAEMTGDPDERMIGVKSDHSTGLT